MPLKIVRNDITQMHTDAIVNTANEAPIVSTGCDYAVYQAAGAEQLLEYRKKHIGYKKQGEVFLTPAYQLKCKYIIHAVSPLYREGDAETEKLLRGCYRKSLELALEKKLNSIAFPLISTGGFGYPKEEGFRIAVEEINAFLINQNSQMVVYIVVFDRKSVQLGNTLYPDLESYINQNYVDRKKQEEYFEWNLRSEQGHRSEKRQNRRLFNVFRRRSEDEPYPSAADGATVNAPPVNASNVNASNVNVPPAEALTTAARTFSEVDENGLNERMQHLEDTFSEYLLYLIDSRGMSYPDVYKRALVDKKVFSKIKNNPDAHPKKITAMCLCVGAKLNLDQAKDLLARAGYALSPCDKTDIIFSYFLENKIYDMIELDIQLEEHGLPCLIS